MSRKFPILANSESGMNGMGEKYHVISCNAMSCFQCKEYEKQIMISL